MFVGYGLDEFRYRFLDLVQQKLICSCDFVFIEDYTIKDIDKIENKYLIFEDEEMVNIDSTTITPTPITFEDVQIENKGMGLNVDNVLNPNDINDVGATKDVVENEVDQEVESVEKLVASNELRWSARDKRPYVRYPSNVYVFFTNG